VTVEPGEKFRLRYGVFIHAGTKDQDPHISKAYRDYVKLSSK